MEFSPLMAIHPKNGVHELQGASTVIDNKTNRVVAIVGGRSQETDTYTLNRAFQSPKTAGKFYQTVDRVYTGTGKWLHIRKQGFRISILTRRSRRAWM